MDINYVYAKENATDTTDIRRISGRNCFLWKQKLKTILQELAELR